MDSYFRVKSEFPSVFKQKLLADPLIKFICKSFLNFGFATMNAQSSLHIILEESIKDDILTIKFKTNFKVPIKPLKLYLIENNMAEYYSQEIYNHFKQLDFQEPCFVIITDPLKSENEKRFQFLTQLAIDTTLKLLNLRIIAIIITTVGLVEEEIEPYNSILHNFLRQTQSILCGGVKKRIYPETRKNFEQSYKLQLLNYYTLEPIGTTAQTKTDMIIYCPTKELIEIKIDMNYEILQEVQDLKTAIEQYAKNPR